MANVSQAFTTQSNATQSQRSKTSVDQLVAKFIQQSEQAGSKSPSEVKKEVTIFAKSYFDKLADENRRAKLFRFAVAKKDDGDLLQRFTSAWLNLLRFIDADAEAHRAAALRCILTAFERTDVVVHNFVPVYNSLSQELPKLSSDAVATLVNLLTDRIKEKSHFKRRWKDCVLLLVTYAASLNEVTIGGEKMSGRAWISTVIGEWLKETGSRENYRHVVSIAKDLGLFGVVENFLTDTVLENMSDETLRAGLSLKAVGVLDHVDQKMCQRLLLALNTIWPASEDGITAELIPLLASLKKILADYPTVGKAMMSLFKQQPGPVLTSEFGFLAMVTLCGIERYRVQAVSEMKKTLLKLWKFDDEINENGWLKETEVGETAAVVRRQMDQLVKRLSQEDTKILLDENETLWSLFGQPLLLIGQALLECPSSKEVTVVDGRVADGCPLWLFAQKIIKETLLSNTSAIPSQLVHIVHAIGSSGNNGAALILIDVLVEIVKKCALEVLNNSKLLDGLFDYVCKMRRDVGVSLIRCLLPIINHRPQLRQALFRNLKNDMLNDATVGAAIPILILLLRSVSQKKCLTAGGPHNFSQSFASFSTQSLEAMGMKPAVDDAVALEIVGILKRCLTQPAPSKIVLYEGITEAASRCPTLVSPCLDLLIDHAATVPGWTPGDMVITAKGVTQLKEPLPQLVQTIECLCYESITAAPEHATQAGDDIVQKAHKLLDQWVAKAVSDDVHDLGIDKVSEWNPTTPAGRANFVFAHMMSSLYDVLIEHVWRKFDALKSNNDLDFLIGLLRRRNELAEVLAEKTVKRKEAKVGSTDAATFDIAQGEVFTSAQSVAAILQKLVPADSSADEIDVVKEDLFAWAVDRAVVLSRDLLRIHHPLHSLISSAGHLISVAGHLLEFYIGVDCVQWMRSFEYDHQLKTKTAETYANICRFICTKYKSSPAKVTKIWQKDPVAGTQPGTQGGGVTGSLVRHVHLIMTKIYPAILALDQRENNENKKKMGAELEKQAKALIRASNSILSVTSGTKPANATFKFLMKMISSNTFASNAVLRDLLKFVSMVGLRCSAADRQVVVELNTMAEEVIQVLSDEGDEQKYTCITASSYQPVAEFLMSTVERVLLSLKATVAFASEFFSKDAKLNDLLCLVFSKADECCDIISRLLPLHTQFHVQKERLVVLLTTFFSTIEAPVDMMNTNYKLLPEMVEWEAVTKLSVLLKKKVHAIMAIADENVGTLEKGEEKGGGNTKRKLAKSKRDESTYVKYVKARESLQSRVLMLCQALKDDRLNLVIKNNSIGILDFRIHMDVINERITRDEEDEPTPKKRKRKSTPAADTTTAEGGEEEEEGDENDENSRDTSAVF